MFGKLWYRWIEKHSHELHQKEITLDVNDPFFDVITPYLFDSLAVGLTLKINLKIMAQINPYIHFNGNAEEAFTFYKSVFGGEFAMISRFKDLKIAEHPISENEANKIMHIALPIGKHSILMGSDTPEFMGKQNENENRSKISISAESKEEADKLFNGLSAGGNVEMPIDNSPWGSYFGMFRDKYGIEWMVDFDPRRKDK
jgi:PhnB protein